MGGPQLKELLCQYCSGWLEHREDRSKKCRICGYTVLPGCEVNVITMFELLSGNKLEDQSPEIQKNLTDYLIVINKFRAIYGKAMICTSGLRTQQHHIDIYKELAKQRGLTFDITKVPMGSKHLKGQAADWSDPDGSLYKYCEDNLQLLEDLGIFIELKDDQKRVHIQSVPYGSWVQGKTHFFKA